MAYNTTITVSKDSGSFTDLADFETQAKAIWQQGMRTLLNDNLISGDLVSALVSYGINGSDYESIRESVWVDQAAYDAALSNQDAQDEIAAVEASGYTVVLTTP